MYMSNCRQCSVRVYNEKDVRLPVIDNLRIKNCIVYDLNIVTVMHQQNVCITNHQFSKGTYTIIDPDETIIIHSCIDNLGSQRYSTYQLCRTCFNKTVTTNSHQEEEQTVVNYPQNPMGEHGSWKLVKNINMYTLGAIMSRE